ncbi:MAG: 23S rRNA (uracil(1939)-C(5))-methyltransferase RlmD [Flavobacteriia bacterium]|nr:23S rRNA (uracil(1939)-C(5))-methyltransferase RlmD [Flavobacteriia bacterium]OIP45216.1 MAG: 23S rRNA (uracil-5-)-methyltransferase RumA [Flavobacteriaceae bacterium CG2_30_31_66]PIV97535.1 MAG: 23S rRNA (uracil(1939)-C(5))-methyltransferase RlmD [Flavobacteriaceae bacterium CG17_big_fil_post_rev_8_21_14_2_50_31_13]PIX11824.1 MAG: 23S rRNA (uracil(1939)-C(5))-methyltransferase RlmD [Flavobacteriaceae bacterium CG_4_8_14_3_um_filter_31_8]PIY14653.1 MAG: 23S rRNA (uracil(1939)-C(5))-methyltra
MPSRERNPFVKRNQVLELLIEDYAFGGKGIARIRSEKGVFVVFVSNTLPGQLVKAQIVKSSKKYAEANLIEVITSSKDEVAMPFQDIPGAPYIQLPVALQHQYKKESTLSLFQRIGNVAHIDDLFDEFITSPNDFHYRNKMEYGFSAIGYDRINKTDIDIFTLGFKRRGVWWMGDNLEKDSGLFDKQLEDNIKNIRIYCEKSGLPPWHGPKKNGFFRYFVVRKSFKTNEFLFNLVTTSDGLDQFSLPKFVEFLLNIFGERMAGLIHTINDETGDRTIATAGSEQLVYGKDKIVEELLGLQFEISMKSFFQTNPKAAEKLYSKVVEYVLEDQSKVDNTVVMDLFCGTGTIGQIVAAKSNNAKIIGVDIIASAIEDAQKNAKRNGIESVDFFAADVGKFLNHHREYINKIKTIILDPARAGIVPKTLQKIIDLNADRMVYVSCNPATQARDTALLHEAGYLLKKICLVDQFPHTSHIETIALFERN